MRVDLLDLDSEIRPGDEEKSICVWESIIEDFVQEGFVIRVAFERRENGAGQIP